MHRRADVGGEAIAEPVERAIELRGRRVRSRSRAAPGEQRARERHVLGSGAGEEQRQDQGALALPQVAPALLAGRRRLGAQVEDVVADLERHAEVDREPRQLVDQRRRGLGDDRAGGDRAGEGVPGGLVRHHLDVLVGRDVPALLGDPGQLERLTLGGLAHDPRDQPEQPERAAQVEQPHVVEQRLERERQHRVPGVDGERHAELDGERRGMAAQLGAVLDVVVDEECIVQQLEGGRGRQDLGVPAAERAAHRDRDRRPQALGLAQRIVEHGAVGGVAAVARPDQLRDVANGRSPTCVEVRVTLRRAQHPLRRETLPSSAVCR